MTPSRIVLPRALLLLTFMAGCAGREQMTTESLSTDKVDHTMADSSGTLASFTTSCTPKSGGPIQVTQPGCVEVSGPPTMLVYTSAQYECRGYYWEYPFYSETLTSSPRVWSYAGGVGTLAVPNVSGYLNTIAAYSPGNATIRCSIGSAVGELDITVLGAPRTLAAVSVVPSSKSMNRGSSFTFVAYLIDQYGEANKIAPLPAVTWTSSNPVVATVNSSGTVTALQRGSTTITAAAQGKQSTATVSVLGVSSVSINTFGPAVATVGHQNDTYATVVCDPGYTGTCPMHTWSSGNTSILSVWPMFGNPSTGKRQGVAPGVADIIACADGLCSSVPITVYPALSVGIAGRSLVKEGQTCQWIGSASGGVAPYGYTWGISQGGMSGGPEPGDPTLYVGMVLSSPTTLQLDVRDSRGVRGVGFKQIGFTTTGINCVY